MKTLRFLVALLAFAPALRAADTTPPTLTITHTWIEKQGTRSNFKMHLDPKDETGLLPLTFGTPPPTNNTIWFRSALNNPNANLSAVAWNWWPWQRGVPFEIGFTCSACVIELQARDAAGNVSATQRRVFQSPFPYTSAPDTDVKLGLPTTVGSTALDCRGLFSGNLDAQGYDDLLQVDRTSGVVTAKLQNSAAPFPLVDQTVLTLTANAIEDSAAADYDKDGRLDLAMIVSGALHLYHNDGLNGSNQLVLTEVTVHAGALSGTTLSTITSVAFGDISGEGKPEIILSGVNGSSATIVGWLDNNASFTFLSGNKCLAPAASSAGRVAVGDVTGDGFGDVVMIDAGQSGVLMFQNDGTGILMGEDRVNAEDRSIATQTGGNFGALTPKSIAVGDVTGDGRADAVVTVNWWGSTNPFDSNDTRTHQFWQLLDSRGRVPFHANSTILLGSGPFSASEDIFASDAILQDLNRDRFPEVILTSQFQPGTGDIGGVRGYQVKSTLSATNQLTSFELQEVAVPTNSLNPHRLAAARFALNKASSVIVAHNDTPGLVWVFNAGSETSSTAPVAIIGATSVDNDPDGSDGPNGIPVYTAYPNSLITYTLTITNNTANTLTNAVIDSLLPPTVTAEDLGGGTVIASGTSNFVRWTETVPANTSLTKQFTARVKATALVGSIIQPKNNIKYGTTNVSSVMPKVTLDEPIMFELLSVKSDSDATGAVVRFGEDIYYRARLSNRGKAAITNTIISMNFPAGSRFSGPVTPMPNTTQVITTTRVDITVPSLAAESVQDVLIFVEAKGADNTVITNSTLTAQRPSGSKRTLAPIKTTIKPAIDIEWYSAYSEFSPRDQSAGEPLKGTQVHYGETIRYRLKIINRSSLAQSGLFVTIPVPAGCVFESPVSAVPGMTYELGAGNKTIAYTIPTLPPSTFHPDGSLHTLSVNTDARLDVECRAADYAKVVQTGAQAQLDGAGRAIVSSGKYELLCRPALEIELRTVPANLASIKPGETITYELQAKNWGINAVTSAKVVNQIPEGTQVFSAQTDNGSGTVSPFRSGDFTGNDQAAVALSATSKPAFILEDRMLVWDLGQVDPGMTKTMRYKVKVSTDLESAYFVKGQPVTLNMLNIEYNFVGTANTGKRIFAFAPLSATYAAPANAEPLWFLPVFGKAPAITVVIDTTAPLPKPQLVLNKHAVGQRIIPEPAAPAEPYAKLPQAQENGDFIFSVDNDSTKANDAIFNYVLRYTNKGGALATNVRVKDVLPPNATFVGFLAKDNVLVSSYAYSRFYDAGGKLLDMNVAANTTKVRSFDLYGGDLAIGESHAFTYQVLVPDAVPVGTVITSTRGGVVGVTNGLDYKAAPGYQLGSDELHFPVNGGPQNVKVKITQVASLVLLMPCGFKSAGGVAAGAGAASVARFGAEDGVTTMATDDPDGLMLAMPYDVRGDAGAAPLPPLSNMRMTFTLPKGYMVDDAYVNSENDVKLKTLNASATVVGTGYVSAVRQANGKITVSFPLDGVPFAWPTAHIIYDPLYKSTLVDANGTMAPAYVDVAINGNYNGTKAMKEVRSQVRIDSRAEPSKDAKLFIGQCAPISAKRGDIITWTIFAGTVGDVDMRGGQIKFNVPGGLEALSATNFRYDAIAVPDVGAPYEYGSVVGTTVNPVGTYIPVGSKSPNFSEVSWPKPLQVGTFITWRIPLYKSMGGAIQIKLRVREDFQGDRIDNNVGGCVIVPVNGMPKDAGLLSIVVRAGDEDGQLAEITQRWLQGAKIKHNDGVTTELKKNFTLTDTSCGISIGGADVMQIKNGVNLIPLPGDRVMLIGPPSKVLNSTTSTWALRNVVESPMLNIVVGPGTSGDVSLIDVPGYTPGTVPANQILTDLGVPGLNILAAKGANILIGNGGNLVRAGAGDFIKAGLTGADAPALILPGGTALLISNVSDAKLIGEDGASMVSGGGGNAVTGDGGWIVAPGSSGVVANDGAGIIGEHGAGLIGHDGSTLIGHDGSTLIGHDGSTLIGKNGAAIIGEHGAGLVGQDGSSMVAGGGGNAVKVDTGNN